MIEELLEGCVCAKPTLHPNLMLMPVTCIEPNVENAAVFNKIFDACKKEIKTEFKKTHSGGIATAHLRIPSYKCSYYNGKLELVILLGSGFYRIQFRSNKQFDFEGKVIMGHRAFATFVNILKDFKIDINKYAIKNGEEVKTTIETPPIRLGRESFANFTFNNVHHIDRHSSFPAGLAETHPEFRPVIELLYEKKKTDRMYKAILNLSIGYMQSKYCGFKYADLSRDAIHNNNAFIRELASRVIAAGGIILDYNTDGFWYQAEKPYHGEGEGEGLGQWSNDHTYCTFRARSAGCYEYIEDGIYNPVVRGLTTLDKIKPRTSWEWGDIYNGKTVKFAFDEERGLCYEQEDEL